MIDYLGNVYSSETEQTQEQEDPGLTCLCGLEGCIWNVCGVY